MPKIKMWSLEQGYLPILMDLNFDKPKTLDNWIIDSIKIKATGIQKKLQNYLQAGIKFMLLFDLHSIEKQKQEQAIEC